MLTSDTRKIITPKSDSDLGGVHPPVCAFATARPDIIGGSGGQGPAEMGPVEILRGR
jgi:hypothetical protein